LPVDHPLVLLVAEPRRLRWSVRDALWVRLVDVGAALAARADAASDPVVLEVVDEFCPWNGGRWRGGVAGRGGRRDPGGRDGARLRLARRIRLDAARAGLSGHGAAARRAGLRRRAVHAVRSGPLVPRNLLIFRRLPLFYVRRASESAPAITRGRSGRRSRSR